MLEIDGAVGEGGGQTLRTALTLSVASGTAFHVTGIRARRPRPGLRLQHLAAVRAAAAIGAAEVEGDEVGSSQVTFSPSDRVGGRHWVDVGSAGSACLVLQTVVPALALAAEPSEIVVTGGTHNRAAPPYDFLAHTYLPVLERLGPRVGARLERHGFEPVGGGRITVTVAPAPSLRRLELLERGAIVERRARALLSRLPARIGERELAVVAERLGWTDEELSVEAVAADGPGNVLLLEVGCETLTEVFTGFGRRGKPAEAVAADAVAATRRYLDAGIPVGSHLVDQLLVPLALGAGGSFVTGSPSAHLTTNAEVIRRFLGVSVDIEPLTSIRTRIEVRPGA